MGELRVLSRATRALGGVALAVAAAIAVHALADAPAKAIARQIRQIEQELGRGVPEDRRGEIQARLARASAAVDARRLYLALYELESAFETTKAFGFAAQSITVRTAADFSARWAALGEPAAGAARSGRPRPVVVDALAASADARAPVTYRASLPYGQDTDVASGLYYLGESQALRAFAEFARSLPWPPAGSAPPLRSIAPELDALEAEVTNAYQKMSPAQHAAYVRTSVTVKRARALNGAGHHAGALLEYLMARYRFATLHPGPAPEPPGPTRVADARGRLEGTLDHSIGRLFVEMAEAALAHENADVRRTAALVIDDVLPAYHAALAAAAPAPGAKADPAVTITLVRWPFT